MEKSTSRTRRNNGPEDSKTTSKADVAQEPESGGVATQSPAAQEARQRIQDAAERITNERGKSLGDTFVDERNDVLSVITELEDQLDRQQDIRETLERELTNSAERLQGANTRVQELEWQVVTLQTRVDALEQVRQQAAVLEEELNDATARSHQFKEQLAVRDKEHGRLKNELKAANKQLDEMWAIRKERDGLRADYKTLSVKVEELERNQREALEERGQLLADIQDLQASLEETVGERNQLQTTLRATEDRVRELLQIQDSLNDKIENLRADKKNLQVQATHLERENSRLVEQRQFYECEVTTLRNQCRTAEAALASVKKAFGEVRVALTETKSRARRRTVDTWPRIGSTLRTDGATPEGVVAQGEADADSVMPATDMHSADTEQPRSTEKPKVNATRTED